MEAGEQETAAALLDRGHDFLLFDVPPAFAEVVARLDTQTLLRHPAVWHAATTVRVTGIPHAQWLREATIVNERLTDATPITVRINVRSDLGNVLSNVGRNAEARVIFTQMEREFATVPETAPVVSGFFALIDARTGHFTRAIDRWNATLPSYADSPITQALGIVQIEALVLRYRGKRAAERSRLDAAIALAAQARSALGTALALEEAAFAAWFAGEDARYGDYVHRLEASVTWASAPGTEVFRAATRGDFTALRLSTGIEHPKIRFYAALIACTLCGAVEREEMARRALEAATESGEPMSAAIACIACAAAAAKRSGNFVRQGRRFAAQVDSVALRAAIDAYAKGTRRCGILTSLVGRFRDKGKRNAPLAPKWQMSLLQCAVELNREPFRVSGRELELLAYLAVRKRACRTEEIAEALWPETSRDDCAAVRVYVNRVRKRLGDADAIVADSGGYRLGPDIVVDLDLIERNVIRSRGPSPLQPDGRTRLRNRLKQLDGGRSLMSARWEWFAPVNVRIDDLMRETATALARDALETGDIASALAVAGRVVERDPLDEPARELVIRAHLAAGDRASALREFRIYRDTLAAELNARPSRALESLVTA